MKNKDNNPRWYLIPVLIATIILASIAVVNTCQTEKMMRQQSNNFNAINRPFVFVESTNITPKYGSNELLEVFYRLKNIGTLPTKISYSTSYFLETIDTSFTFDRRVSAPISALFPANSIQNKVTIDITYSELVKRKYQHYFIEYIDDTGKTYYYKKIEKHRLKGFDIISSDVWSDYN